MANHSDPHMQRLAGISASRRRAEKLARLIESAPPLEADRVAHLCRLLNQHVAGGAQ